MHIELPESISREDVLEFQQLYEKTYNDTLSFKEAESTALRLLQIVYLLHLTPVDKSSEV